MAELVDARDLKSLGRKAVPVRFRLRAPIKTGVYEKSQAPVNLTIICLEPILNQIKTKNTIAYYRLITNPATAAVNTASTPAANQRNLDGASFIAFTLP